MKCWMLDYYAASTFNKCLHQILPAMEGLTIQIHIDKPVALRKPALFPCTGRIALSRIYFEMKH